MNYVCDYICVDPHIYTYVYKYILFTKEEIYHVQIQPIHDLSTLDFLEKKSDTLTMILYISFPFYYSIKHND